jgi:formate/nitrite transporter FocA (FNT family)
MPKSPSPPPHLEPFQEAQAASHAPLEAIVIHEIIRSEGESELARPVSALIWSGLAAGLSMGFSFAVQALLQSELKGLVAEHAIASLGYTVGFAIVVLGRQQLFTESTLSAVLPPLTRRDRESILSTLRLWTWVLLANLVGTWLFAVMLTFANPFGPDVEPSLAKLAAETIAHPFGIVLVKAVVAGWLIALMTWLLPTGGSAKLLIIVVLTWVVAFGRLSHVIAGSSEAAYGVLTGAAGMIDYLWRFLLPTLIGNTIGGVALVAMLNHAPVSHKIEPRA